MSELNKTKRNPSFLLTYKQDNNNCQHGIKCPRQFPCVVLLMSIRETLQKLLLSMFYLEMKFSLQLASQT